MAETSEFIFHFFSTNFASGKASFISRYTHYKCTLNHSNKSAGSELPNINRSVKNNGKLILTAKTKQNKIRNKPAMWPIFRFCFSLSPLKSLFQFCKAKYWALILEEIHDSKMENAKWGFQRKADRKHRVQLRQTEKENSLDKTFQDV